jgi:peroxiredoxin
MSRPSLSRPCVARALALLVLAVPLPAAAAPGRVAALPAPEIVLADGLNGVTAQTTLASLRGRPVLLAFWIPICPHCQAAASTLERLRRTYEPHGLAVLAVSHGKKPYVDRWLRQRGFAFGVGFDWSGHSAARYGVRSLPGVFLIGKDGSLRASGLGAMDGAIRAELSRP